MTGRKIAGVLVLGLACGSARASAPGDDCASPLVVSLPAGLPFTDLHQHTCGRGNLYDGTNTCLGAYADGEEIIYRLQVTSPVEVQITMDPRGQSYTAIVLSSDCPPLNGCLAWCYDDTSATRILPCRALAPGTYTLMVDCLPVPSCGICLPDFNLSITACELPRGACCVDLDCVGTLTADACAANGGAWYPDFDCTTFACPLELPALPENCPTACAISSAPFSATCTTYFATADGPPGSCNEPGTPAMRNDVWFTYTPTQDCELSLTVQYHLYDGLTVVYAGPHCQALTELYCLNADGLGDLTSDTVSLSAAAGTTYWVQIGDYGANPGGGQTLLALSCTTALLRGDVNCDGSVGFGDINPFVLLLSNRPAWLATFPGCPVLNGDINADGSVDFGDINPFVMLLSGFPAP